MSGTTFESAFDFTGQVALVTGGASGIGHAIAIALADRGARLALIDKAANVEAVAAQLPGSGHMGCAVDLLDARLLEQTVDSIVERLGKIDILVNNAGIVRLGPAESLSETDWDLTLAVNLKAPFMMSQLVGRHMLERGHGRIVNIASQAALVALDQHVAYSASKAAIVSMTKILALEWGPRGINTNAISPTVVDTELGRKAWEGEKGVAFKQKIPTGRFAQPDEIALAALFLASGAAAMINGENLVVDGGYTIQ
jgi:NAD(P)-dependent dehydrogenase (short-subunit alcohol dehydrogenase family)